MQTHVHTHTGTEQQLAQLENQSYYGIKQSYMGMQMRTLTQMHACMHGCIHTVTVYPASKPIILNY